MTDTSTRPHSHTRAIILTVVGGLLVLGGPMLGGLLGSFALIPGAFNSVQQVARVDPTATITLEAGERVYLLAPATRLGEIDHSDCVIESAPQSTEVEFAAASRLNTRADGLHYESFGIVTARQAGAYTINCAATEVPVVTAPPFELATFFGPLLWTTVGGLVLAAGGVVMVIIGIVRFSRTPQRAPSPRPQESSSEPVAD
ncbi:hypothetical protein FB566_3821 [Stackebrandtia endophytica]|uniref:Uncharacterized protein n=1 Tax=Stackebrandtia endophytica TaxID=1496996 RepID=A0A543B081_9ACTN|nr:hypothetical protein [Stackebrandtia endophytica]TQL78238.1 hypothetical protein FB566_3821 [Stackebrandtia endophytica]